MMEMEMWHTATDAKLDQKETLTILRDQATRHLLTKEDIFAAPHSIEDEAFTLSSRYSDSAFQGIMPDTGAAGVSTAGKPQFLALQRLDPRVQLDVSSTGAHTVKFGKGEAASTPFLFCLNNMDRMKVKLDNLQNVLVQGSKVIPIVRKWGHPFMLLNCAEESYAYSHLTEPDLRQLHRRFGHPSVQRLT